MQFFFLQAFFFFGLRKCNQTFQKFFVGMIASGNLHSPKKMYNYCSLNVYRVLIIVVIRQKHHVLSVYGKCLVYVKAIDPCKSCSTLSIPVFHAIHSKLPNLSILPDLLHL